MTEGKDFWHDVRVGITKELITKAVAFVFGLPVVLVVLAAVWHSVAEWLLGDSHVVHWVVVLLGWLLLISLAATARMVFLQQRGNKVVVTSAGQPPIPVRFAPETFDLSPARSRALLALRQRVDSRTTLHTLFELVTEMTDSTDMKLTKAQLQQDMEAAERAGIVSIERASALTQYYNLTTPAGRDWVLSRESDMEGEARKGLTRRAQGPRHF